MHYLLVLGLLVALVFGPQLWTRYTMQRYSKPLQRIKGNGRELARHLLDRFDMSDYKVEQAGEEGDHFDPATNTVRLSEGNYSNNSLTAIAVAAHEVGHAIQHHRGEHKIAVRTRLAQLAYSAQKLGSVLIMLSPIAAMITRAPSISLVTIVIGLGSMFLAVLVHLATLPVEIDASFGKALPILKQGYIEPDDEIAVKRILRSAAFTYVAASLSSLLNLWRWLAILRR